MIDGEKNEELSRIADKVWSGAFVRFDKDFDAPGKLAVFQTQTKGTFKGCNLVLMEMTENPRMIPAMKAALLVLSGETK